MKRRKYSIVNTLTALVLILLTALPSVLASYDERNQPTKLHSIESGHTLSERRSILTDIPLEADLSAIADRKENISLLEEVKQTPDENGADSSLYKELEAAGLPFDEEYEMADLPFKEFEMENLPFEEFEMTDLPANEDREEVDLPPDQDREEADLPPVEEIEPEKPTDGDEEEADNEAMNPDINEMEEDLELVTERIVKTDLELKEALGDTTTSTIYLGADITITNEAVTGGILIGNKPVIEVIGTSPDENHETVYTLTSYNLSNGSQTSEIQVPLTNTVTKDIIVRDMHIEGYNYYGPFTVVSTSSKNVTITYDTVSYHGPQLIYNRSGSIVIKDCIIDVEKTGTTNSHEVGEVSNVRFEGTNRITHDATGANYALWLPFDFGGIVCAKDSYTEFSSNTAFYYGTNNLHSLILEEGAELNFTGTDNSVSTLPRFNMSTFHTITLDNSAACRFSIAPSTSIAVSSYGDISLGRSGIFDLTTDTTVESLRVSSGSIHLQSDSLLNVHAPAKTVNAAVNVAKGMTIEIDASLSIMANSSRAALETGGDLTFTEPEGVLLYNSSTRALRYSAIKELSIETTQLNFWSSLPTNSLFATPEHQWLHDDSTILSLVGTVATGALGNIGNILSSILPGLLDPPAFAGFNLTKGKIISFGSLELEATIYPQNSILHLAGITKPLSDVLLTYHHNGEQTIHLTANLLGIYELNLSSDIPDGTILSIVSSSNFLYLSITIRIVTPVLVFASPPDHLIFETTPVTSGVSRIKRVNPDWTLHIKDTWGIGSTWKLYGTLKEELHPSGLTQVPSLGGALRFVSKSGIETIMHKDTKVLLYTHVADLIPVTNVDITWAADKGFLLQVDTRQILAGTLYSAAIEWSLVNGP